MKTLEEIRRNIDEIDSQMLKLFLERMDLSSEVAVIKKASGKAIYDREREEEKLDSLTRGIDDKEIREEVIDFFNELMYLSKKRQEKM